MDFFNMETNERIVSWVVNNLVLLYLIKYGIDYICKKTPWAADDDLPSFFGGAIDLILNSRTKKGDT